MQQGGGLRVLHLQLMKTLLQGDVPVISLLTLRTPRDAKDNKRNNAEITW